MSCHSTEKGRCAVEDFGRTYHLSIWLCPLTFGNDTYLVCPEMSEGILISQVVVIIYNNCQATTTNIVIGSVLQLFLYASNRMYIDLFSSYNLNNGMINCWNLCNDYSLIMITTMLTLYIHITCWFVGHACNHSKQIIRLKHS